VNTEAVPIVGQYEILPLIHDALGLLGGNIEQAYYLHDGLDLRPLQLEPCPCNFKLSKSST
jgi:hypothetical protein